MGWDTFLNIVDIGIDLAQYGKLKQATRQLGHLEQLGQEAALSQEQLLNLRDIIFKYKQVASEIIKSENSDKILATYHMLSLKNKLSDSGIKPELFPEFVDKEYVSAIINGINDNYNRMWSLISSAEQRAISDYRNAMDDIKLEGRHYINKDKLMTISLLYKDTISMFLSLCKTESYINEIRELTCMDVNNAKRQPEIENKCVDGDKASEDLKFAARVEDQVGKGGDVNTRNKEGDTPLSTAICSGELDFVKYLVGKGADVNAKDKDGGTLLHTAMGMVGLFDDSMNVFKFLVGNGADVNAKDKEGETQLMWAAYEGKLDVVKVLVDNGADVNAKNKAGWTPLMMAASQGNLDVIEFLVDNNADVKAKDSWINGSTALDLALMQGHQDVVEFLEDCLLNRDEIIPLPNAITTNDHKLMRPGVIVISIIIIFGVLLLVLYNLGQESDEIIPIQAVTPQPLSTDSQEKPSAEPALEAAAVMPVQAVASQPIATNNEEQVARSMIRVEKIMKTGDKLQAMINHKIVNVGDKVFVEVNGRKHYFKVNSIDIQKQSVQIVPIQPE